jgi:acyl dehydratase
VTQQVQIQELSGYDLGSHEASYAARDAILYALAVGAPASQLDLVYERDLRVLPTYACALGLWAVEKAGKLGAYDPRRSLHASQSLRMHRALPRQGTLSMRGRIAAVWDKGKASIVDIAVTSEVFDATYTIFLPGVGHWGGSAGPAASTEPARSGESWEGTCQTSPELAALYRLTGDLHPIHIDPQVARANGFDRPILHGLCTLAIATRMAAAAGRAHAADLVRLKARMSGVVLPGDPISVRARRVAAGEVLFSAEVGGRSVLKDGTAAFGSLAAAENT